MKQDPMSLDPSAAFETPEALRDSPGLTTAQKVELLKRWAYDDAEMSVATEEAMPEGRQAPLQQRILMALEQLGAKLDFEHAAPSKQHGLPDDGDPTA